MSLYKLLALDIDGTVLNSRGQISPRVVSAIAGARHAGMLVTLATPSLFSIYERPPCQWRKPYRLRPRWLSATAPW